MAALELLGRKWALRVLWELHHHSPCSFRGLQKLCGDLSPTVLNSRLTELREAGIIALRKNEGYIITGEGIALGKIILDLNEWAMHWAQRVKIGPDDVPAWSKDWKAKELSPRRKK